MPTRPPSLWTDRPDDWLSAADDAPGQVPPPGSGPPPAPAARRGRRPVVAGLAALALAGGLGGAYLAGAEDGDPARAAALPAATGTLQPTTTGAIYQRASAGVVSVQTGSGSGTGFVVDREGTLVTNAHVVGDATQVRVRFGDDDAPVSARVAGTDPSTDLAVLRVDPADVPGGLRPLPLASSRDVRVGDQVVAIGYPLGLDRTATAGIVSGLGREIQAPNGFSIDEVIQTDAPINPGNSGGPLLDARGRVIGVNSQIATAGAGGGNVGIGFAVPADTVREVVPQLAAGRSVAHPWLGVSSVPAPSGGVRVDAVTAGSPAAQAGVQVGDVVTRVADRAVREPDDVSAAVAAREPGDELELTVRRGGGEQTLGITLGTRPERTP
jgi:putative serine protease PepD